jgi:hypothetical protein
MAAAAFLTYCDPNTIRQGCRNPAIALRPAAVSRCAKFPDPLRWSMGRAILVLLILVFLIIGGGFAYLATRDMPPPTARIEREIPNERLLPQ